MTRVFDGRRHDHERRFAAQEEFRFKALARRNKLLGLWAAEKMGFSVQEAEEYARAVVKADFEAPGDEDVLAKVLGDLRAKNVDQSEQQVRLAMDELFEQAIKQVAVEAV